MRPYLQICAMLETQTFPKLKSKHTIHDLALSDKERVMNTLNMVCGFSVRLTSFKNGTDSCIYTYLIKSPPTVAILGKYQIFLKMINYTFEKITPCYFLHIL